MINEIISALISGSALVISILVYLRQRSLENENYFFQYKIEQYMQLISGASGLLELTHKGLLGFKDELEDILPDNDELNDIADEVEEKMSEFRTVLQKSCAFIPKEIVENLDKLYDDIFDLQQIFEEEELKINEINAGMDQVDLLEDKLEAIINLMRKDLGIEAIDVRLKRRTT